jgi:peptidoglycan/xylan/chitin deacetylase (PgdA/CDA1 family)
MDRTTGNESWARRIVKTLLPRRSGARAAVDRDALVVLRYRNVGPTGPLTGGLGHTPSPAEFEHQISWVAGHFQVIPLAEGVQRLREGTLGGLRVAITFDDPLAGVGRFAVPILEAHRAPATFFINTRFATGEELNWHAMAAFICRTGNERVLRQAFEANVTDSEALGQLPWMATPLWMNRFFSMEEVLPTVREVFRLCWGKRPVPTISMQIEQLNRLSRRLFSFGSHTGGRYVLSRLDAPTLHAELVEAHRRLGTLVNRPVRAVAYPLGRMGVHFDERALALVRGTLGVPDFAADQRANVTHHAERPLHRMWLTGRRPGAWARQIATAVQQARSVQEVVAATAGADGGLFGVCEEITL